MSIHTTAVLTIYRVVNKTESLHDPGPDHDGVPADGPGGQKWNAVPDGLKATPLKNIREHEK